MSSPVQTAVQIAWVTPDLDATEAALTNLLGVKKWVRLPDVHFAPETCTYRGEPADFHANISLSYLGEMQLELIAPVRGASIYSEFLRANPAGGLHHICTEAADVEHFDAALSSAAARGTYVVSQGVMPGGIRFAYLSDAAAGVPYLEIAHIPDEIRSFFDHIKQEQQ
jgi:catechol 2,3-dioxygenase-like lactoylglutathione lyase family enzyme